MNLDAVATRGRYRSQPADGPRSTQPLVLGLDGMLRDLYGSRPTQIP